MSSPLSSPRIAFLGLGLMGSGMAHRLLTAKFSVAVYNRNPAKAALFTEAGAQVATTPRDAAANAQVIVSMVADDDAARSVWLGPQGALAALSPGTICIECSTVSVSWIRELATAVTARSGEFIDAPVTGSRNQAASGELNFIVGGAADTLEKVRPVLAAMGKTTTLLGPVGSGALVKLINNFICGVQVASLAEAIAMIERSGLDRAKALEILTAGAPGSPLVRTVSTRMAQSDYTPNFLTRLMAKDLAYAQQEAKMQSLHLATATAALEVFRSAITAGHGEKDIAAVIEPLRQKPV